MSLPGLDDVRARLVVTERRQAVRVVRPVVTEGHARAVRRPPHELEDELDDLAEKCVMKPDRLAREVVDE